jgi:[ribosomal protein S5]-alanine N-acetyltransferase
MIRLVSIERRGFVRERLAEVSPVVVDVVGSTADMYERTGFSPPWIAYLAFLDGAGWVGSCAFKAPPEKNCVEIAYFTFPEYEGRGYATEMAQLLVETARAAVPRIQVNAQTLPHGSASTRILTKLGFEFVGTAEHPEDGLVWEWKLLPREP